LYGGVGEERISHEIRYNLITFINSIPRDKRGRDSFAFAMDGARLSLGPDYKGREEKE